jgi:hypothetical protein
MPKTTAAAAPITAQTAHCRVVVSIHMESSDLNEKAITAVRIAATGQTVHETTRTMHGAAK